MKPRILLPALAVALTGFVASAQQPSPYCREFTEPVRVGGVIHNAYGTTCQQPDGSWQIVQQPVPYPSQQYVQPQPVEYYQPDTVAYGEPYYYPYYPAPFAFSFGYSNWHGGGWGGGWHGGGGWHH